MGLEEKAKTTKQFCDELSPSCILDCPLEDKLSQVDCSICEKEKWVLVSVAQQEIDDCRTSWQNLKDTILKFDAKILYLGNQLKYCNRLIDEMRRERGLQKQKLRDWMKEYGFTIGDDIGHNKLEDLFRE